MVTRDVQGSFCGIETGDDVEAWLVNGTLWLLGVLKGNADLV